VLSSVGGGAASSWSLANLAPRILRGDLEPGFFVAHFVKDLGIALDHATRMGLDLPGLALARELYASLAAGGHERAGTQALVVELARRSNLAWP
jgi:3-hydroxyisobutyrate dehydrogenase